MLCPLAIRLLKQPSPKEPKFPQESHPQAGERLNPPAVPDRGGLVSPEEISGTLNNFPEHLVGQTEAEPCEQEHTLTVTA